MIQLLFMSYYLIPNNNNNIPQINVFLSNVLPNVCISTSVNKYLKKLKYNIEDVIEQWDNIKKYNNPYEFINATVPNSKTSVSKLKTLSRSFYKMIEIYKTHNFKFDGNINTFHLAEGPGGFIEALVYMRNNKNDVYNGMTLIDDNKITPGWKRSVCFLKKNKNISIELGEDGTGNLLHLNNLIYIINTYKDSMDLITGDGGFDFSVDYDKQEIISSKLIFAQFLYALSMQKQGGHFILKVFDLFTPFSVDLVYLLSIFYEKVYINKPCSSRYANSEKYIVCKNLVIDPIIKNNYINQLMFYFDKLNDNNVYINRILKNTIPYNFIIKLEEINAIFGQQQIENIYNTITLIENKKLDKLEHIKKNNILKCINWCQKYNIPYNKHNYQVNVFISDKPSNSIM